MLRSELKLPRIGLISRVRRAAHAGSSEITESLWRALARSFASLDLALFSLRSRTCLLPLALPLVVSTAGITSYAQLGLR